MCRGYGPIPSDLMFVGISAGRLGALVTKVPLTKDASGRIFQRCLGRLGLSKSDEFSIEPELGCYITNLAKGRFLTDAGLNRIPNDEEIAFWLSYFEDEVFEVKPTRIIALGDLVYSKVRRQWPNITKPVHHPRWFQAHGAINPESKAFAQMVQEYGKAITKRV